MIDFLKINNIVKNKSDLSCFFFYNENSASRKIKSIVTRCYINIKITFKKIESEVTSLYFCEKYHIENSVSHNLFFFYKIIIWLIFLIKNNIEKIRAVGD